LQLPTHDNPTHVHIVVVYRLPIARTTAYNAYNDKVKDITLIILKCF